MNPTHYPITPLASRGLLTALCSSLFESIAAGAILLMVQALSAAPIAFSSASDYDSNFAEAYNGSQVAWTSAGGGYVQRTGANASAAIYNTSATGGSGGAGGTTVGSPLDKFSNFTIQADYSTSYIAGVPSNSFGFYTKIDDAGTAGYAVIFRVISDTTVDVRLFESNGTLSNAGVGSQIGSTLVITGPANSFLVNTFYTIKLTVTDVGPNVQFDASVWTTGGTQIGSTQSLTDTSSAVTGLGQVGVRMASDVRMDNFAVTSAIPAPIAFGSASDYDSNFVETYNGSQVAWTSAGGGYVQRTGANASAAIYNTSATGGSGGAGGTALGSSLDKFSNFTIQADYSTSYIAGIPSNSFGFYTKIDDAGTAGYAAIFRITSATTMDFRLFESNGTLSNAGVGSQIGSTLVITGPANSFLVNAFYTIKLTVTDVGPNVQFDASVWTIGGTQIGSTQSLTDTSSAVTGLGQVGVRLASDVRMDNFAVTPAATTVTAPVFSPGGGTFSSAQSVNLTSATSGASIRYTTNGTTPTSTTGTVYSGPVAIAATTTLKAIAYKAGMPDSTVTTAIYTITASAQTAAPSFSPSGGTFYVPQTIALSTATSGASIRYTTNGSTPTSTNGTLYSTPVSITGTTTLKAVAYKSGLTDSAVTSGTYTILVYDSYIPTRADVGVTATQLSELTEYNAPTTELLNWTTGGTASNPLVISGKIIYGQVVRKASYVTFINCLFRGPPTKPGNETAVINCQDTTTSGWKFYDCTIAPQFPNPNQNAFIGHEYKAFRCHAYWVVDGFGVYTLPGSTRDTNVEIAGCLVEDLVYFPGPYYANASAYVLNNSGTYVAYVPANTATYVSRAVQQPGDMPWVDNGHPDGNHADGVQIQGAYGPMVRSTTVDPQTGLKPWTGTGVYIHGNSFQTTDAYDCTADPSGLGLPVPGKAGSLTGSSLGFGDNPKRGIPQSPTMTRPSTTGLQMFDGGYPANGAGIIPGQAVNQFQYPTAARPNDYSVVIEANFIDKYHLGLNSHVGNFPKMSVAFLYNEFGRNVYRFGSDPINNPQIYPMRIDYQATTLFAPADSGSAGVSTNTWLDATSTWHLDGSPLYWIPPPWSDPQKKEVRTSGIWYDH